MIPPRPAEPETPRARLRRTLAALEPPQLVLAAMVVVWIVVFGILVVERQERFGSFGFDMGIFDQAIWLAARGKAFITVRGLDIFGHHANVAFYLLAPFSWLGAGPNFLNVLQVSALGLSAVPLYALGRRLGIRPWAALAPPAAYLLHPSTQFLAWELFHPESVAILPLLLAYLAARRERWGWYTAMLVLAVSWKEDVALLAFVLGLLVLLRGHRKVGLWTMGASLAWFVFVTRFLLGAVNGIGPFYDQFYGSLGNSPLGVAHTVLVHPSEVWSRVAAHDSVLYLWRLSVPFGGIFLAAPLVLLMGVPQLVANILSVNGFTREITFHYAALPIAALALATVEGLAWVGRRREVLQAALALGLVMVALVATVHWGASPIGSRYDQGFWPPGGDARQPVKETAVSLVPSHAAVSATYSFVAHLSHREQIYEFPNPFRERNWGVHGEDVPDPSVVTWLVLDRQTMGPQDEALAERVIGSGSWQVLLDRDGIVVAHRAP